ncbi:hypothetical protein MGG_01900 [Pyricularia oryzae 70-15]|uniref:Uncharacterized protein n=1 Tax=Pyricularia oryzae (strain 70-15 / ATCC MYA-4617 / FGSC 8958) TaxID=242507 RepID=G4MWR2_PYRO7|nr:uncharacterized protein MGG_01900 [Pyricularia oryzae 70-15]EHA55117.1 hypothetical protein MGG_01900 [Pyricularia oryzae 70-15]
MKEFATLLDPGSLSAPLLLGASAAAIITDVGSPEVSHVVDERVDDYRVVLDDYDDGNETPHVHAEFNRRFGDARLHIASLQAYVTSCHGHFFAVTRWETSNARNIAKDANSGTGGSCRLVVFRGSMIRYMFVLGDGAFEWRVDRRDC